MKNLRNQNGFAIVVAVMILAILTLIGISSTMIANTELKISTNHAIHTMTFYAAESGAPTAIPWLCELDLENDTNKDWFMPLDENGNQEWYHLSNKTSYAFQVRHMLDADGNILYNGDPDGNYLWEVNTVGGLPLEIIESEGTHIRGGRAKIETAWMFEPFFIDPGAALRVWSSVNANGVSHAISGENHLDPTYDCPAVPDIMYDIIGGEMDVAGGDYGPDGLKIVKSTGVYPFSLIKDKLKAKADSIVTTISGNQWDSATADLIEASTIDDPVVIYVTAEAGDKITNPINGYGILVLEGTNFELAGNLNWNGLILTGGDLTMSGGGEKNIFGSIICAGEALAINGNVNTYYDCRVIQKLFDHYATYRMLYWRQV